MMAKRKGSFPDQLIRPLVRKLHGYVPGEQPNVRGLIKLNTNENPAPPSPKVIRAIRSAADRRLRFYPDPAAQPLREALAKFHCCRPENIIIGNGSDELLALATRAFVEPRQAGATTRRQVAKQTVQYFTPSYSLYPVLADIHGARRNEVKLPGNFELPASDVLRKSNWNFSAALTYITTPNAPSGCGYATRDLAKLCAAQNGVTILDEAYVDFADEHALRLAKRFQHVIVSRTFSKAYSLCFQRVGYFVGHPTLIGALDRIRDSYNVNGLGQAAALATLSNIGYYRKQFSRIVRLREETTGALETIGFDVLPSQANFIFVEPAGLTAEEWFRALRERKILTRWFDASKARNRLRITIGTEAEMARFLTATRSILRQ
ncbi:MAG: histidinol-phosphate transaminase [Verrucomicrobiota bacterium]|jgi:histidinol-phosphate aminotransferase|nr:histidinol-phosphate transaminase [Verrucomicrobiota bacterium]MDP6250662.1 histidinol-phosphate transaminase [Verrucomicrobiota bacterium]MDP7291463.1 histidinol-phosphate transaminase [Verrucomicrobiota bacterium]MDP7440335.1 histidinol-phosphate transaminase [Verrucomicrobiota bacterium]HJN82788.1 histidinol-phosphate transaminase [Verrucomicrobiota bacterium]|tara:strand:+ start:984 stop:2114 length:1131 start_codon:yes stop_codon:yes gene_type:complete